jgi:uncharacterized protein (TIGR04255 family)
MKSRKLRRRPRDLPDFSRPPLNELVLSIQFARQIRNIDVGVIWRLFRKRYPNVEEQAPLTPVYEKFGLPPGSAEPLSFRFSSTPEVRYWFINKEGDQLLQVQSDRLIHNWRQTSPDAEYPRYEPVRAEFLREVRRVDTFFQREGLDSIRPNQCEVSYINNIFFEEGIEPEDKFDKVFTVWQEAYASDYLSHSERAQFSASYVIPSPNGTSEPLGRLHVQASPAIVRTTSKRVIQFSLTVRGKPANDTVESAFEWLDRGREVVVRSFTAMTREEMHDVWGRNR